MLKYQKILDNMSTEEKAEFFQRLGKIKSKKEKRAKRAGKFRWDYSIRKVKHTYTCGLCGNVSSKVFTVNTVAKKESPCYPEDLNLQSATCSHCLKHFSDRIDNASFPSVEIHAILILLIRTIEEVTYEAKI